MKLTNRIQCQFHSKTDPTIKPKNRIQPLNPHIRFNVNSIQRQIQTLNPLIGFKVNSIQG